MKKLALISLLPLAATVWADEDPLVVNVPRLSADMVVKIAQGALAACRKQGIPISVTVVDRSGIPQIQLRDTTAPPVSYSISFKKAYTAVMFNMKGTEMEKRMHNSPLNAIGEPLAFMGGSVPIQAGGRLYGAVGVSGAPTGDQDEKCATAGLNAVIEDLEMM